MWHLDVCAVADTPFTASADDLGVVRWLVVLQVLPIGAGIGWMEIVFVLNRSRWFYFNQ